MHIISTQQLKHRPSDWTKLLSRGTGLSSIEQSQKYNLYFVKYVYWAKYSFIASWTKISSFFLGGGGHGRPTFLWPFCDQIIGHTGYYYVSNERCGHHLSTDTPLFSVGKVVWILQPLKVQHFFRILKTAWKWPFLQSSETPFFGSFFSKC